MLKNMLYSHHYHHNYLIISTEHAQIVVMVMFWYNY